MTLILKTKDKINNAQAPYLLQYDVQESKKGSIYLWDAGLAPVSTVATDTVFPNCIPDYPESQGSNLILKRGANEVDKFVKAEITAKGGLHFMATQESLETDNWGNSWVSLMANDQFKSKLSAPFLEGTPNLYVSLWLTTTRQVEKQTSLGPVLTYIQANTNNLGFYIGTGHTGFGMAGASPYPTTSKLGKNFKTESIVGIPNYYVGAVDRVGGTGVTATSNLYLGTGASSPFSGTASGAQAHNGCPSFIVYRFYVEDLNKSGRTYEEVKAIDIAEHTKAFSEGGRFYDDAWTNPKDAFIEE